MLRADIYHPLDPLLHEVNRLSGGTRLLPKRCSMIAVLLIDRAESHPDEREYLNKVFQDRLIPLWRSGIKNSKNRMNIPNDVWLFATIVDTENGQNMVRWGAEKLSESLPKYAQIKSYFPNVMITNGNDGVLTGMSRNGHHMADYIFRDVCEGINKILALCKENIWTQEAKAWCSVRDYFYNLLLNIDLTSVDPRLIEYIYEYVLSERQNIDPETFTKIIDKVSTWEFARRYVHGGSSRKSFPRLM